jgi:hypothetical protein
VSWVYAVPSWLVALSFIVGLSVLSVTGLLIVHRCLRPSEIDHNDVAGPIVATVGTVLAVMLSFMVVTMWQEYDQAAGVVATEAGEIADLYHEARALTPSTRDAIRGGLKIYVAQLVDDEWPLMRSGRISETARATLFRVVDAVEGFDPRTMAQQNAQADAITHAHNILDARRARLFANAQAVPPILWTMMVFIALVTIAASYLFRVRSLAAHVVMTVALASVIAAIFAMIAELDLPFRGDLQIPPAAYAQDVRVFDAGD